MRSLQSARECTRRAYDDVFFFNGCWMQSRRLCVYGGNGWCVFVFYVCVHAKKVIQSKTYANQQTQPERDRTPLINAHEIGVTKMSTLSDKMLHSARSLLWISRSIPECSVDDRGDPSIPICTHMICLTCCMQVFLLFLLYNLRWSCWFLFWEWLMRMVMLTFIFTIRIIIEYCYENLLFV